MWKKEDLKTLGTALIVAPVLYGLFSLILAIPEQGKIMRKFWDSQKYRIQFWLIHAVLYPFLFFLLFANLPGADFMRIIRLIGFGV